MFRSWTITHWLAAIFVIAVLITGLAVGLLLQWQVNNSVLQLAQSQARATAYQVFQTAYASMRRGTAHEDIPEIMERLNTGAGPGKVRLIRSDTVAAQYGDLSVSKDIRRTDPLVRLVFQTGQQAVSRDADRVRHLFPLMLEPECMACHRGTPGETMNGLIDIDLPLSAFRMPLNLMSDAAFLAFMAALTVILTVLFVTVRTLVVNPIHSLADTMSRLTENPTEDGRVFVRDFRTRELRRLATSFNDMMARVSSQRLALQDHAAAVTNAKEAAEMARIRADAANMAKSHFLASMSHELRTPLNAVLGFSEVLRDELFGPLGTARYRDYANDIHVSGTHLRDLVNDLLDLARIEAGKFELWPEPVRVCREIAACLQLFRERAANGRLTIVTDCPESLPDLFADQRAVRQVISNLVSNAVKYTPAGGRIDIIARATDSTITIAVTDTGVGIPKKFHDLVFAAYGQVINVETRDIEGTGLGLSLVRALMEQHGGSITLDSTEGHGATFTLTFPRRDDVVSDPEMLLVGKDAP